MKIALFFLMMLSTMVFAQMNDGKYGNEWIDYSKTYYKFKISEDGVYRIPANYLQMSGVDMSRLNEN